MFLTVCLALAQVHFFHQPQTCLQFPASRHINTSDPKSYKTQPDLSAKPLEGVSKQTHYYLNGSHLDSCILFLLVFIRGTERTVLIFFHSLTLDFILHILAFLKEEDLGKVEKY